MAKKNVSEAKVIESSNTEVVVHPKHQEILEITSADTSKSVKIRKLHALLGADNKARSEVAKILNIRYQHVRNVLITPIKKG